MFYFIMCMICLYLIWIGIFRIIKYKLKIRKNLSVFLLGVLAIFCLSYLLTDLPAFIKGGNEITIVITEIDGGRKSLIYSYTDEKQNTYWSSGIGVDYATWAYFKKEGIDKEKYSQIRYLPHTRMIMYIFEDGREVYNFLSELGICALIGFAMVVFLGIKEVMKDAIKKS